MAFSDLCHISNAFKSVENETDQSEHIMEENSMVRDLITKILDETGPSDSTSSIQPSEKTLSSISTNSINYKNDAGNTAFAPRACNYNNMYNFTQSEPNGFSYNPNGFTSNGFVNFPDNDVNSLLGFDTVDTTDSVSPEQLNLLRLAAQEIGGAQFQNPTKFDYNFFEPNQRNSLPEANLFPANYNRPNSLNVDMNFNANFDNQNFNSQRYPNKFEGSFMKDQNDSTEILAYLNQLNISLDRSREDNGHNMDFKMPEMNGHFQNEDFNRTQEDRNKMFYNRNFNQPPKSFNGDSNFYLNDMIPPMNERNQMPNFDFNQSQPNMNYKPNGFQNDFRREMGQYNRDFQGNGIERNFDNQMNRENMQQALLRQNELARQMSILMRNRPPPNQLNVDVNFLHENTPYNLGLGALLGPSPSVLPSPMLDIPLLAPFHAMRNMRSAATSSGILHARLDACYEQWRQLERERKRTEARLALAYPGRAVSSSNSIPVPRLPPCPTRVDRLTVDMLREHTKVLTLMGKMETLRASVCVAQNKKPNKTEDCRITVLKRGQEDLPNDAERGDGDPESFDPASWKDDVKNLAEIAPHSEVESAMLAWRSAVAGVQAARRRELARHSHTHDPILQLADAVKQLAACARRARCAMWCDLTLTVALAPGKQLDSPQTNTAKSRETASPNQNKAQGNGKPTTSENKEEKPATETAPVEPKPEANNNANKPANKQTDKQDKNQQRRTQNYRNKLNQSRNDFYKNNQRYDNRFMHNRHPYHYLATGPIN